MKPARLFALLGLVLAAHDGGARADESPPAWSALGPFLFSRSDADGSRTAGFRPFYVRRTDAAGETAETTVLYPLFYYRRYGVVYEWSVFKLITRVGRVAGAPSAEQSEVPVSERNFDIWPFYFSRRSPDPDSSYQGLFPIYGDIRDFLGYERLSWTLFPIYARGERKGAATTYIIWPIFRATQGSEQGYAAWPIFGHRERSNGERRNFFLWPLVWNNTLPAGPEAAPGTLPTREVGALPFYTGTRRQGSVEETYLWPFFGYTDRTEPDRYHETRYFWPFLVQGRGDKGHLVDRWGPFYTHSFVKGVDSTWVLWPFWHRRFWDEGSIEETKTQFFYFFSWSLEQRSLIHPNAAPASKHHFWPVVSAWDNGAGRKQFQILSPFEPLFNDNPEVRETWSPFFAVIRHNQTAPGETQTSLLWNALAWSRSDNRLSRFSLGPLVTFLRQPDGGGWHASWFDFSSRN